MSNVFLQNQDYSAPVKRNPYDLQRLNNGTFRSGIIYPIGWDEVGFGDSIRLNINAGLRTLPMPWPIQTPIIAKFYTFYVRFRTLQKNFCDFRFGNKPIVHPYIALSADSNFWKTGELGDYLGVPTTYASDHVFQYLKLHSPAISGVSPKNFPPVYRSGQLFSTSLSYDNSDNSQIIRFTSPRVSKRDLESDYLYVDKSLLVDSPSGRVILCLFQYVSLFGTLDLVCRGYVQFDVSSVIDLDGNLKLPLNSGTYFYTKNNQSLSLNGGIVKALSVIPDFSDGDFLFGITYHGQDEVPCLNDDTFTMSDYDRLIKIDSGAGITQLSDVNNPFSGSNPVIPLSAMPCRAYESIYRSHFQDFINEPFIIDGEPQYNRYITNDDDGADTTDYSLKHRNWEADRFTSCKPSPQQGLAPIVGVNSSGDIVLQRQDGEEVSYSLTFDKEGVLDGWNESVAGQAKGDPSIKRRLLDLATTGFTINALRDVNSYQLWKEATYRKSPKFKDQVRSVFGVDLEYKELDMPEFLGGFDVMLNVNEITQTSSSVEGSPLGDLAGRGAFVGRAKHSISHYCDEEGIVMTVMCITPIPVYSQMLDRKWLKSNPLDYYNPQFGKIGNQAVTYEEVCPVQAYNEGVDVHDVFGYQRPWYHYISSYDEVHGLFRDSMNGFVMQRIFGSTPELGKDFLHIDESQLNEVFIAGQGQDDTFYGQINYDCKIKRGIPRFSIPSLE